MKLVYPSCVLVSAFCHSVTPASLVIRVTNNPVHMKRTVDMLVSIFSRDFSAAFCSAAEEIVASVNDMPETLIDRHAFLASKEVMTERSDFSAARKHFVAVSVVIPGQLPKEVR